MLWLHQTNTRGRRMGVRGLLSAALQNGWRIVRASPEEQAMLDAHGFGSRRIQRGGQKPYAERRSGPDVQFRILRVQAGGVRQPD
jgi:hypothetical protein